MYNFPCYSFHILIIIFTIELYFIIQNYKHKYIYQCNPLYLCTLSVISTQIYQQHRDISRGYTGNA